MNGTLTTKFFDRLLTLGFAGTFVLQFSQCFIEQVPEICVTCWPEVEYMQKVTGVELGERLRS